MPYVIADTPYYMTYFDGDDNCFYIRTKEKSVPESSTKELKFDSLTGKTPCDKCSHLFVCGKKDEYRKSVEDIITALGEAPGFLHISVVCIYFDNYKG